ncbi:uncharacterized protein LOC116427509 [Nomia melanderi]|uniref:uncharacterized protein LOC116427509 n=1 Tax=Nomia melanderi TaxID=2448451 RepID=UPI0013043BA6|nr:calponin homology domain-containing protein DDB_G0272472-like [Nomia melanderi]
MNERFWCRYAYILVLSVLFHSFLSCCNFESFNDASSAEINNFAEEQRVNPDPSIERIFLSPNERKNAIREPKLTSETHKISSQSLASPNHVRVKRGNTAKKNNRRSLSEASKPAEKRAVSVKDSKSSSRSDRSLNVAKLGSKTSTDYEAALDQKRPEYADEIEDESSFNAEDDRSASYKASEFKLSEDTGRFIDQEERSSLYDDSEAKDVVKRGIVSAEDYEEFDEEPFDEAEDTVAAQDEGESFEEDAGRRRTERNEGRVKREHSKREVPVKTEGSAASDDPAKSSEVSLKDAKPAKDATIAEGQASKLGKDSQVTEDGQAKQEKDAKATEDQANNADQVSNDQTDQSKRNIADIQTNDGFKVVPDGDTVDTKQSVVANDQMEAGANENSKPVNEEHPIATEEGKIVDKISSSNDEKGANDRPGLDGATKIEDTKVAEAPSPDTAKIDAPASSPEAKVSEDTAKYENPLNTDTQTAEQSDKDYEKHMEEQIQRKIDSIKEEIKREIAKNEQLKEIERNNARFDELLDQEEEEEEEEQQAAEAESSGMKENLSKRSARNLDKSQTRSNGDKRSVRLQKRQKESMQTSGSSDSRLEKKSARQKVGKRSVGSSQLDQGSNVMSLKKRNSPREVYLVRRDRNAGKKRRRRRSGEATLSEMGNVKFQERSAASGARLRGDLKVED